MKKITLLLSILLFTTCFIAKAQQKNDWYVETTAFTPYLSAKPDVVQTAYRYDTANRLILVFTSIGDRITTHLYDYDPAGNITHQTTLSFVKDTIKSNKYYALGTSFDEKTFQGIIQNIIDRLKSGRNSPQN